MVETTKDLERMSKDMRAPLRNLRKALSSMVQAQQITDAWISLLDQHRLGLSLEAQAMVDEWFADDDDADAGHSVDGAIETAEDDAAEGGSNLK